MVLKATAYTVHGFWQSRRNRIDLLITVLGLAWTVVHFGMAAPPFSSPTSSPISSPPTDNKQLRRLTYTFGYMTTILRFFTIVGRKTTLKMLMLTVVMSMVGAKISKIY
jgi:hypothetical protein